MQWVLIDLSYLAHRARVAYAGMDAAEAMLFGLLDEFRVVCNHPRVLSNRALLCMDSRKSYRKARFSDYKRKRQENMTEQEKHEHSLMREALRIFRHEFLPVLGVQARGQAGLEADDIMAQAVLRLEQSDEDGIMITGDQDLLQCITPNVSWYDIQRDKFYTDHTFRAEYEISPKEWGDVKAMGGCSSDNVPGIKGVGKGSAIDYLLNRMPHHHKRYQTIKAAREGGELRYWRSLVVLPHKKTRPFPLREPSYSPREFRALCKKWDIDSLYKGKRRAGWNNIMTGNFPGSPRKRHGKRQGILV